MHDDRPAKDAYHRRHAEAGDRDHIGEPAENPDVPGINTKLFFNLAQGGLFGRGLAFVASAAGKRDLTFVALDALRSTRK